MLKMKSILLLFINFCAIGLYAQTNVSSVVVQTTDGKVSGYIENDLNIFKGVPFAAPPVGELRWKATQPVKAWTGVLDCTKFSPSPVQNSPMPFMYWSTEFLIPKEP